MGVWKRYPAGEIMKVLVIPDVHLKPWMFVRASELMQTVNIDKAVCLMDIADEWGQQMNLGLYMQTYDEAIRFAKKYPDTLWCYGNHDLCYLWNERESGYSPAAAGLVCQKFRELKETIRNEEQIAYIHRIDNVMFLHGGLTDRFVRRHVPKRIYDDIDEVIKHINNLGPAEMWDEGSPIWYRPQYGKEKMYKQGEFLQAAGHTPMKKITLEGAVLSCDVFSTDRNRRPYGSQEYLYLDTVTLEFAGLV